jgi:transcriptional accessory protein Tex/SPT6
MRTTTEQEMYGLYRSWKDSGKTRAEFAKENGLVPATFYYWAKKFSRTGKEEALPVAGFRRLDVAIPSGQGAVARISYPSGITVELFGSPDPNLIRSLTE